MSTTASHPLGDSRLPDRLPGLRGEVPRERVTWVVWFDLAAKLALLCFLALVLIDPEWGNLEGKAPVTRAITYPLFAFTVPVLWVAWLSRRRGAHYPWLADLFITLVCFSDILGNRLDLYDRVGWFDDWIHLVNSALLSAAVILLTLAPGARPSVIIERGVAFGVTASLAWELFEYVSFVTRSPELPTAYADTLGDLLLGWCGSLLAAVVIAFAWRAAARRSEPTPPTGGPQRDDVIQERR